MRLTDDELRDVLARAEEIQRSSRRGDGKLYVAEVVSVSDAGVRVRFLRGSEHTVMHDEIRPFALIPGERVVCEWPWWGAWTSTVVTYDAARQRVKLSDGWGTTKTFPLAEVWLAPPRKFDVSRSRARLYATLLGAGATVGAIIGSIITALVVG